MNILWISYILVGIYTLVLSVISSKNKRKRFFLIIVSLQLILLFVMRDIDVGVDLVRYERVYVDISRSSILDILGNQEYYTSILFYLIVYILTRINISYHAFLGIVGIISVLPYTYLINKYSNHAYLSIIIHLSMGIYSFQFSGLKQSVAMSLVVLAFIASIERKKKNFYIYIILAMLFHVTAVICLPFYALYKLKYRKWMVGPLFSCLIVVYLFKNRIGYLLTSLFSEGEYIGKYDSSGSIGTVSVLLLILLIIILIFANIDITDNDKKISYFFKLLIISICIQFMSAYAYSFTRLNFYYLQFLPIIISNIIDLPLKSRFRNDKIKIIFSLLSYCILFISAFYMYDINVINGDNTINYHFYSS